MNNLLQILGQHLTDEQMVTPWWVIILLVGVGIAIGAVIRPPRDR